MRQLPAILFALSLMAIGIVALVYEFLNKAYGGAFITGASLFLVAGLGWLFEVLDE
jgi:hypothetical protein